MSRAVCDAKSAGIKQPPQLEVATSVGGGIEALQAARRKLGALIDKSEGMHDDLREQAELLTRGVSDAMLAARTACDALELSISDDLWPLPKYREMLFPV
jgi:glutamine synthetase